MPHLHPEPSETIVAAAFALRAGRLTARQLTSECLAKIDACEPQINAWVEVDRSGALDRAAELDRDFAAGRWHGPLHGIPLGIKDIIDVAGFATAAGSAPRAGQIAARDAFLVARLRAAGAIILGKTVTTQFAGFDPPPTRNPWNLNRTPGGSSSGSAAAVAAGMCLGAIGSQTGGSIIRPASFCGVAGCKPTFGRVSLAGVLPLAKHLDHAGPIARCVADLALLLDVIAGPDAQDRLCLTAPPPSVWAALQGNQGAAPRIGTLAGLFIERAESVSRLKFEAALRLFAASGATIRAATLPREFDDVIPRHRNVMAAEAAAQHRSHYAVAREEYRPHIRALIEEGLALSAAEYVRCRDHQAQLSVEIDGSFHGCDVLACPATLGPAPDHSSTGDPAFNSPWSYTGVPVVTIPLGLAVESAAPHTPHDRPVESPFATGDALPLGLQLVARRGDEVRLFRAAAWCERVLSPRMTPASGNGAAF